MEHPVDEKAYFEVARDLLTGKFHEKWRYTIGFPIIYIPFILFTGAKNYFDIAFPLSFF